MVRDLKDGLLVEVGGAKRFGDAYICGHIEEGNDPSSSLLMSCGRSFQMDLPEALTFTSSHLLLKLVGLPLPRSFLLSSFNALFSHRA